MPSSGKITSAACCSAAWRARAIVRSALNAGSATRTCGTALATRTKPWEYSDLNGAGGIKTLVGGGPGLQIMPNGRGADRPGHNGAWPRLVAGGHATRRVGDPVAP